MRSMVEGHRPPIARTLRLIGRALRSMDSALPPPCGRSPSPYRGGSSAFCQIQSARTVLSGRTPTFSGSTAGSFSARRGVAISHSLKVR